MKVLKRILVVSVVLFIILLSACSQSEEEVIPSDLTSLEMARLMGYGINLGNTMEACDASNRIPGRDPGIYEQMWGQPITTQEMITGMREAGFKTLRIPVAWTNAMDFENDDLTINQAYLDRVEEIINYALNEDMFVIVNDHWDHGWWSLFSHPEPAMRDKAMDIFAAMWTQVAEQYKDYDHRLVLEAANEELGNRFNDKTPFNPDGGRMTEDECYELLTVVTQRFIDIVRGTGGMNANRFLLIPGYNTDIAMTCDDRFVMPVDTVENKLMLSVHYYTPWGYCGDRSSVSNWGTTSEVEEQNRLLSMMARYTDQGYGIVLGEWGVLDNEGEDRYDYFINYLNNCDKYGYAPMLWDTNLLYSKSQRVILADDIAELFKNRSTEARASMTTEEIILAAEEGMALSLAKAAEKPEIIIEADEAFAWIMFNSGDWAVQYSAGDVYKPADITAGVIATDAEITGEGTYELSLDFTGTTDGYANGIVFSAVGLINGEILFPGYFIDIKEIHVNGEPASLIGRPYTTSDNGICTRVNLYNNWVTSLPDDARIARGGLTGASWIPLENHIHDHIETIKVVFDYISGE